MRLLGKERKSSSVEKQDALLALNMVPKKLGAPKQAINRVTSKPENVTYFNDLKNMSKNMS